MIHHKKNAATSGCGILPVRHQDRQRAEFT